MAENKVTKLSDEDSERAVVAAMLRDKDKVDKALLTLSPKFFSKKLYKNLYNVITKVRIKHGSLITNELVSNYLESWGIDQNVRILYLQELDSLRKCKVNDAEFAFASNSIKKAYISKCMAELLHRGTEVLNKKGGISAFNAIDKKLYDLKVDTVDASYMTLIDTRKVDPFLDYLKELRESPEKFKGIPSGWNTLDTLTAGLQKGEYALIIAKSGSGKSMAMINWANHAQKTGHNVVYVSLEMPEKVIRMRQLSLEAGIQFIKLKTQNLTAQELNKQEATLRNEIANRDGAFYVLDVPKCTVGLIEAQLRQLQQNMPIDIVFIDYLGLLKPEAYSKGKGGWEIAYNISNDLKELARTMKIAVVSANQVTTDGMKKKSSDDLEIEDVAISRRIIDPVDIVVGLIWNKNAPNELNMSVPKCRGGRIQSAKLYCDLDVCKITDMANDNDFSPTVVEALPEPPDEKDLEV